MFRLDFLFNLAVNHPSGRCFAYAQHDTQPVILRLCRSPLGRSPPLRHAMRATSPASTGEHTPGRVVFFGVYTKNKKSERKIFLRSDFNHIVKLFVNYII